MQECLHAFSLSHWSDMPVHTLIQDREQVHEFPVTVGRYISIDPNANL